MEQPRYVPCLRWKRGEYQAVSRLSREAQAIIVPLIEVPEIGFDFETREETSTVDEHLATLGPRILKHWGSAACMIDLRLLDPSEKMANGDLPVTHAFRQLRATGAQAIPVVTTSFGRQEMRAARRIVAEDGRGACLRLGIEESASRELKGRVDGLLGEMRLSPTQCDVVLDLGAPSFDPLEDFASLSEALIAGFPYLKRWRSLTLLGGSFPSTLAGISKGTTVLPRNEWRLYRLLRGRSTLSGARMPDFGDYGVGHPDVIPGDMRLLKPAAALRYTIDDGWLVKKGTSVRAAGGYRQFPGLCQQIVRSRHYAGPAFSAGDKQIADCASGRAGTGNLTTWRFAGTSHHLERVAKDLATLSAP